MARLTKDLTQVKGKAKQAQFHQDNTVKGAKKLDEGQTVVCYVCQKEGSIFVMPKKDASTSCNDLCLDSSLCNQVYVEKVVLDTCTQEIARRMSNSSKK